MNDVKFASPIYVRDGLYLVREIKTLMEVIDFLEDWPEPQRDRHHTEAMNICIAVLRGRKPLVSAYVAFTSFAKRMDILEDSETGSLWLAISAKGEDRTPA